MIVIWSQSHQHRVFHQLSPVLRSVPDLPIQVVKDCSVPEGTTLILALGSQSLQTLQAHKIIPKNRTVTSYRTQPLSYHGTPLMVSYSSDIGDIDHKYYIDLLTDVTLAVRYALTGKWKPIYGKYRYVPDFTELCEKIRQQHLATADAVDISKDLETVGLDPYALPTISPKFPGAYIVTMQVSAEPGTADVVRFESKQHEEDMLQSVAFREQVDFLLNCPYVRLKGANFKFDLHWLWKRGKFTCKTFTFDTTIVGSLLDENRTNSLNVHTKIHVPSLAGYDDEFNRTVDKSRMDLVPAETLLPYAGGDVDADLQVAAVMKQELLKDHKLTRFYVNILHPAARAFEWIEQGGICVDLEEFKSLKNDLELAHIENVKNASQIIGGRIVIKHRDTDRPGGMNLTKAALLKDFMFSPMGLNLKPLMYTAKPDKDGIKRPSTAMEHLLMFEDDPNAKPFIDIIKDDGNVMKTYTTYVEGFLEYLRSDNRFHPTYFLFVGDQQEDEGGARTGRLSCKAPAFQTLPKHTKWAYRIRKCYPAPPGYVVVERDYSQGELRVIACIANEFNMIQAYKEGIDLHVKTPAPLKGLTYQQALDLKNTDPKVFKELRQRGKAGNFGWVFGMQARGFVVYARRNYRVEVTLTEAEEYRESFFKDYPMLPVYHEEYEKIAHRDKQVRTPLGRIRHLPMIDSPKSEYVAQAERQAINSPVQGTLTDMVLWTIAIEQQSGLSAIAPCFGACHDAIYNYVPEDQVDVLLPKMLETMENLPFEKVGWKPQLKFLADGKVGPNMADLKEV